MHDASDTRHLPDPFLRLKAGDVACAAPVFAAPQDTVAQAARLMARAGATAALVRDGEDGPVLGILTERDVLVRVVAAGLDPASLPVTGVMTSPLLSVRPEELLIEAFSRMVRHGVRRLVLLDAAGRPAGLLGEGNMLAARGESPLALASEIAAAPDLEGLTKSFRRLHRMAGQSVAEGIGSDAVGRLISEMHDRILLRAWDMALAMLGPAPAPHAMLVLGSQGRREQYLATDQDLALVYEGKGQETEEWFAQLGRELTRMLLEVGFPPCPSRIMLDNPEWRRSLDSWLDLFDSVADRPEAQAVVTASLLADLRPLQTQGAAGEGQDGGLGPRLREAMASRLRSSPVLLKFMAREAVRFSPPLGLFGSLSLKKDAQGRGSLDVKRGGVFPITQGAKVLALEHGLAATGTRERLLGLKRAGLLGAPMAEGLCEACDLLQTLRMRSQAEALRQGLAPGNDIRPEELGRLDLERLRGAFKLVAEFQDLLYEKYALRLLA